MRCFDCLADRSIDRDKIPILLFVTRPNGKVLSEAFKHYKMCHINYNFGKGEAIILEEKTLDHSFIKLILVLFECSLRIKIIMSQFIDAFGTGPYNFRLVVFCWFD